MNNLIINEDCKKLYGRLSTFVKKVINRDVPNKIYPIGSIYISVNSTNPSELFGGTWEQIQDTFLLASGTTYTNGSTGGEATHTLTTNEMPSHTHVQNAHSHNPSSKGANWVPNTQSVTRSRFSTSSGNKYIPATESMEHWVWGGTSSTTATNQNTGGGQAHNNMPPYLAVYMWQRIA